VRWKILHKFCRPFPSKKKQKFCPDQTRFFFFAAGEERDGASKRGTGFGLEREMVHWRGLVFSVRLGWTPMPSIKSCGLGSGFFFFTADEERDEAPERGTDVGLEREMVHQRGLVFGIRMGWTLMPSIGSCGLGSDKITAVTREKDRGEGEKEKAQRNGEKMMGMFYMVF
jgi:hypothetical protein